MTRPFGRFHRPGTIACLMAITCVVLVSFLALAIDIGMLATARTQAQHGADLAALTAARTVNGNPVGNYNKPAATVNAQNILTYNKILGQPITASQLTLTYGSYDYNQTNQTFGPNFPALAGRPATCVQAVITTTNVSGAFSRALGYQFLPDLSVMAQCAHRPRDIALVLDLSGSMRMGTCHLFDFYTTSGTTNNPDPLVPKFGHYSSASAEMQGPSTSRTSAYEDYEIPPSNVTAPNGNYSKTFLNNFYAND